MELIFVVYQQVVPFKYEILQLNFLFCDTAISACMCIDFITCSPYFCRCQL